MPRCKNKDCKTKFIAKKFLQKYCSIECSKSTDDKPYKIPVKSERTTELEKIYKPVRKSFLLANKYCEVCANKAVEIHHKNGREYERLIDVNYFMAICSDCHKWVHNNPKESREKGYLI